MACISPAIASAGGYFPLEKTLWISICGMEGVLCCGCGASLRCCFGRFPRYTEKAVVLVRNQQIFLCLLLQYLTCSLLLIADRLSLVSSIEPVAPVVFLVDTYEYHQRWSLSSITTIVRYFNCLQKICSTHFVPGRSRMSINETK